MGRAPGMDMGFAYTHVQPIGRKDGGGRQPTNAGPDDNDISYASF
jgi:hypothetical protein